MCKMSYQLIQGLIEDVVQTHGGLWVTTIDALKEELRSEFPDLQSRRAFDHPLVGLVRATGLRSLVLDYGCPGVIAILRPDRVSELAQLRREAQEGAFGDGVRIALAEAGLYSEEAAV